MQQNNLIAKNIIAGYESRKILSDVSIEIPRGKISVILGSNGCGKSTMLKTLARLIKPEVGEIILDEKNIREYRSKEVARILGLLPQSPTVPEGIRVSDLVMRGRFPYKKFMCNATQGDYDAVLEAMEIMGITELADRCVDELSGGQRQRVWIALALAQDTDILLLDEPITYLDVAYQVEILNIIKNLNKTKGTTIAMVLHDINLSARYADHIFAMKKGELIAQGAPKDIITPEMMDEVFGLKCTIIEDPVVGTPLVVPL